MIIGALYILDRKTEDLDNHLQQELQEKERLQKNLQSLQAEAEYLQAQKLYP